MRPSLICLLLLGSIVVESEQESSPSFEAETRHNSPFYLVNTTLKCSMYSNDCFFALFVRADYEIGDIELKFNTSNVISIKSKELCKNLELQPRCKETKDNHNCTAEFRTYIVALNVNLIGKEIITIADKNSLRKVFYEVLISEPNRTIDFIFEVYSWIMQWVISIMMGILVQTESLVKLVQSPLPVVIGVACQYVLMPLVCLAFVTILSVPNIEALAIFMYGCSPVGNQSNNWTFIFDGDVDLSVVLIFCSSFSSIFFIPAWYHSFGKLFFANYELKVPFIQSLVNLSLTVGPFILGYLISLIHPNVRNLTYKFAKPFIIVAILTFLYSILYAKLYLIHVLSYKDYLAALIPWCGFLLSGMIAYLCKLQKSQMLTISVQTTFQNVSFVILILTYNFDTPEKEYAGLPLMAIGLLTPLPFYVIPFIMIGFRSVKKLFDVITKKNKTNDDDDDEVDDNEFKGII